MVHCAGIKQQLLVTLLTVKTAVTDQTNLDEDLSVRVIDENDEKQDVETVYFDQDQSNNIRASSHMDDYGEETPPPTVREVLEAHANDTACTWAALTIGLPKSMFSLATEVALVQISPIYGTCQ